MIIIPARDSNSAPAASVLSREMTLVFDAMHDSVVVTDLHNVILYLNPAAHGMTGWEQGQTAEVNGTIRIMQDGRQHPLAASVSDLPGLDGQKLGHIMTLHDVTEQKLNDEIHHRTIEELKKTIEDLTRSNTALKKFSHIAAHDLKSPVSAIVQLTDLLNLKYGTTLDDKGNELIRCVADSANRMRILVDDLLNYASITTTAPQTAIDCTIALEQALESLKGLIHDHKALISYSNLPGTSLPSAHLVQVFQNLIRNAVQYSGVPEPAIHISATAHENYWLFSIRDNGKGIAQKYHETIFEPFQRLHGHEHAGSGIGLAVCRKIIEGAGGKIWVESEIGNHTTFLFTLARSL